MEDLRMNEDRPIAAAEALDALDRKRNREISKLHSCFNEKLEGVKIEAAIDWWKLSVESESEENPTENLKETLDMATMRYTALKGLLKLGVIDPCWDVDLFNHNHTCVLYALKCLQTISDEERKNKLEALVVFTLFLREKSNDRFPLLQAPPELNFQMTVRNAAPKTLNISQWIEFRNALDELSLRDGLVAKLMSYTARGLSEILNLQLDALDFSGNNVRIRVKNEENEDVWIQLDSSMTEQLQHYIQGSQQYRSTSNPLIFVTKKGKPVYRTHFKKIFDKVSENAEFGFRVTNAMIQWAQVGDWLRRVKMNKETIMKKLHLRTFPRNLET
ncbi:hypothetical protein SCG7086_AI_00060 [Chlamydiales bacterium SCGC AG-110-P3]|nr:hypothetical protein SCG7086_AI_00060 [Chlamydiales bacterium SCGC AG-110-P3]